MAKPEDVVVPLDWSMFNIEQFGPASQYRHNLRQREYGYNLITSAGLNPLSRADLFWFIYGIGYVCRALHDLAIAYHQPEFYDPALEAVECTLPDVMAQLVPFVPKSALDGEATSCQRREMLVRDKEWWQGLQGVVIQAFQFYVYPESSYVKAQADRRRDLMQQVLRKSDMANEGAACRCLLGAKSFVNLVSRQYNLSEGSDAQLRMALAQVGGDLINYTPEWLRESALPRD